MLKVTLLYAFILFFSYDELKQTLAAGKRKTDRNITRGRDFRLEEKHYEEQGLSLFINTNDSSLTIMINIRQIIGNDSYNNILNSLMTNEINDRRCLLVISAIFQFSINCMVN